VGGGGSDGFGEGAGAVAGGFAEPDVVVVGAVVGTGGAALVSAQASSARTAVVAPPSTTTASKPRTTDRLVAVAGLGVGDSSAMSVMGLMRIHSINEQRRLLRIATRAR
jgi:hypothetical protein